LTRPGALPCNIEPMNTAAFGLAIALGLLPVLKGGAGAPPPAGPAPSEDDGLTPVKGDKGDFEFRAPPGFTEQAPKKGGIVKHLQYSGNPYQSSQIKVYAYEGWKKAEFIDKFTKDMERQIKGNITYPWDSKTRFLSDIQGSSGDWWISLVECKVEFDHGYAIECLVPKAVYDVNPDTWTKVADSFKPLAAPVDPFTVPPSWKLQKVPMFAILGPVNELKERKDKDLLERRMAQITLWMDSDRPFAKLFVDVFDDSRKVFPRSPIHVLPTPEAFKAAAGDRWTEGATAIYLPDHPEKVVVVDGSPDSALQENALLAEAGVQYAETRIGKMWPWLRVAYRAYFDAALRKGAMSGLMPPEMVKRGKEVFAKTAVPFEELMKKDDAGMRALGEDGVISAWGILQAGLHGSDGPIRNVFRGIVRDGTGAPDLGIVWDKLTAKYKDETKKPFKPALVDAAAKKYFKDLKEEKEKK
jgi:hypothetical protein